MLQLCNAAGKSLISMKTSTGSLLMSSLFEISCQKQSLHWGTTAPHTLARMSEASFALPAPNPASDPEGNTPGECRQVPHPASPASAVGSSSLPKLSCKRRKRDQRKVYLSTFSKANPATVDLHPRTKATPCKLLRRISEGLRLSALPGATLTGSCSSAAIPSSGNVSLSWNPP